MDNQYTPKFKIYKRAFVCSCCKESSFMGIVGYSTQYPNICDLCLVNELDDSEEAVDATQPIDQHQSLTLPVVQPSS
ncbi:hypothetical protein [Eisenibacter elegans]|uniref:hypothetical protein n=1 Tax=Eisenibacter elegans TaxID=997 RepID=UPI0003FB1BB4|nr:hypothetical protein [Eisenibacter elegans]